MRKATLTPEEKKARQQERSRRYYEANLDKIKEYQKAYREAHRDEIREKREQNRNYYERNKQKIRERRNGKAESDPSGAAKNLPR